VGGPLCVCVLGQALCGRQFVEWSPYLWEALSRRLSEYRITPASIFRPMIDDRNDRLVHVYNFYMNSSCEHMKDRLQLQNAGGIEFARVLTLWV